MTPDLGAARIYTDFQGLADLRRTAKTDSDEALKEVAAQFEAIFIQMMLKSMRDASLADGVFDSQQSDMYMEMFDQQIAQDLSSNGAFGIAEMMIRQLGGEQGPAPANRAVPVDRTQARDRATGFESPEEFVSSLMPDARRAADKIGVNPELLIAQAALETGWGQRMIQRSDGSNSYNLFGIKSGASWKGESARVTTLEYRDGVVQKEQADFRAYNSFSESFDDYVDFVSSNSRYDSALKHGGNPEQYIEALHDAGYATDPAYAQKVIDIMRRAAG